MTTRMFHSCISIRGVLSWSARDFKRFAKAFKNADGSPFTPDQAREYLFDHLSQGHEVLERAKRGAA